MADSRESIRDSHANREDSLQIDSRFGKTVFFCESTFQKMDSSEERTPIT